MSLRIHHFLAAAGLWIAPALPGLANAGEAIPPTEPAPLVIEPVHSPMTDHQLAVVVAGQLKQSGQLRHYCIDVAVRSGVVELTGRVADPTQRDEVMRLVHGVGGVKLVVDRMALQPEGAIKQAQAETVQPPVPETREPAQLLPKAPMPTGNAPIEPMPMMMGRAQSPYDLAQPKMPPYAWPTYAPYNNYSRVACPTEYPYNAWPFIGPQYPFPKVPLGWRSVKLEWMDGYWWYGRLGTAHDWWRLRYW